MSMALRKEESSYTYSDYLTWDDGKRWEIIDGVVYDMSPAPIIDHQRISGALFYMIYNFLSDKRCEVFSAPFDVILPKIGEKEDDSTTVVQPDIVVVCDNQKLTKRGCTGAPDLVIEILSLSTAKKDMTVKMKLYQRAGVRELWVVHPEEKWVQIFIFSEGNLVSMQSFDDSGLPEVSVLPGLTIELPRVFAAAEF